MASFLGGKRNGDGRSGEARDMLRGMANPGTVGAGGMSGKSDMDRLNDAVMKITQNAAERNFRADIEAEAAEEAAYADALALANKKEIEVEDQIGRADEEYDDDDEMQTLQEKRLAALKARVHAEKQHQVQGHGEYREIEEEDFLKEVRRGRERSVCGAGLGRVLSRRSSLAPEAALPAPPPAVRRRCAVRSTWWFTFRTPSSSAAASWTSTCASSRPNTARPNFCTSTPTRPLSLSRSSR